MPQYGTVLRAKPRLTVKRGFDPNQPKAGTVARRVKSGVTVLSGQVISQALNNSDNVYEWELGCAAGRQPFFALQDSADFDVREADSLVGYSCLGDFHLQTAYFKSGQSYPVDTYLTYDGVTGNVKPTTLESGEPIVGIVIESPRNLLAAQANGIPATSGVVSGEVLVFKPVFLPNTTDAIA